MSILETRSFEEASKQVVWVTTMEEREKIIEKINTWELVNCPHGNVIIGV